MNGDVSTVKKHYIATKGVYLQGESGKVYDYEDKVATEQPEDTEEIEEYPEQEQVQPIKESGGVVADMSTGDNVLSI
jgi:hypothetical protein